VRHEQGHYQEAQLIRLYLLSGKTTLLLTILRLLSYTGTITIDGIDISAIPSQQLRSRITTISQDSIRLEGTVRENLLPYSGQSEDGTITEDIIFEALDQTELTDIIKARGGLNAPLSAMEFSEGHMQLLCLARAIVHNTCTQSRVVLLDEPTSSLDLETDNRIQAMMRDAFLDCTMVMVSHRPETLWDANVRLEVKDRGVSRITAKQHPPQNW
jgi:ABC-type multidrug transport system fused ATPase/permease subunit